MRATKAQESLCTCTSLPEPSFLNNVMSTKKISCAGSYICSFPLGYPLDGIMQVEEEEEENNSDNETYTIEEDVRQRRKARGLPGSSEGDAKTTKSKRSFPRPGKKGEGEVMSKTCVKWPLSK